MTDRLILDDYVDEALERARRDLGAARSDAVRAIVQDGLEAHGYLPADDLDEDSEAEGTA